MIGNEYTKKSIKCPYCGHDMELDDVDYNFDGCQDNFYVCEHCHSDLVEKIRFGKVWKVSCSKGDQNENKTN